MIERGLALMVPAPMGPIQDEGCMRGRGPHKMPKQMAHFGSREGNQGMQVLTSRLLVPTRSPGTWAPRGQIAQRGSVSIGQSNWMLPSQGGMLGLRLSNRGNREAIK